MDALWVDMNLVVGLAERAAILAAPENFCANILKV